MNHPAYFLLLGIILLSGCSTFCHGAVVITELYDNTYVNDDWNRRHEVARATVEAELIEMGYNFVFHPYPNVSDNAAAYEIMKQEAENGTQLFILHNTRFIQAAKNISAAYPQMRFITTPSVGVFGNYTYNIYGYLYQASWLAGITCGLMTETNNVGIISLKFMRGSVSYNNAFMLGAKYANPRVQVHIVQIDDVTGFLQERKAAEVLVQDYKCDCAMGGTLTSAYKRWDELGIYSIGALGYDRYIGTDMTLFGTYYDFTPFYREGLVGFANGTFPAGRADYGDLGQVVDLSGFSPKIPVDVKRRLDEEYRRVINGTEKIFCGNRVYPPMNSSTSCMDKMSIIRSTQWFPSLNNPRNVTYNDSISYIFIPYDHPWAVSLQLLTGFCMLITIPLAALVIYFRESRRVSRRSPIFLLLILLGSNIMWISVFLGYGDPTPASCQTMPWLFCIGFGLAYGAMVFKNVRIWILFQNSSMEAFGISNRELLLYGIAPVEIAMAIVLFGWTFGSPYRPVIGQFQQGIAVYEFNKRCMSDSPAPAIILVVLCFLLVLIGFIAAMRVKGVGKHSTDLDESEQLKYALSITLIFGMAMICVSQFSSGYNAFYEIAVFNVVQFICGCVPTGFIVMPLAHMAHKRTLDHHSSASSHTNATTLQSGGATHRSGGKHSSSTRTQASQSSSAQAQ